MRDISDDALASARENIESELQEQVAKGRYDEGKARFLASLVSTSTGYEHFADCDLVLEAVFEEPSSRSRSSPSCATTSNPSASSRRTPRASP